MEHRPFTAALAGNPNVGKSTIFNGLTGLRQHTGNWSGVTVAPAAGQCRDGGQDFLLVDLPGTYSLDAHSREEEVTRDFLNQGHADVIVVVCDATCVERGLYLLKQILKLDPVRDRGTPLILCVNLCDEARKKGIFIDFGLLQDVLQFPVVPCCARSQEDLLTLKRTIRESAGTVGCYDCLDFSPKQLARETVRYTNVNYRRREEILDRIVTGRITGNLLMILLLLGIFWLTMAGANVPSEWLWNLLFSLEDRLAAGLAWLGASEFLTNLLVRGAYRVLAWVVSVMLPPMAIFFPLFTLLEDLGYLPRVAFNMDRAFMRCRACGKQCLTMAMGLGCNAAGVVGCRIIDSPRERLVAILTNALIPCNGRFPTLVTLITLFFMAGGLWAGGGAAATPNQNAAAAVSVRNMAGQSAVASTLDGAAVSVQNAARQTAIASAWGGAAAAGEPGIAAAARTGISGGASTLMTSLASALMLTALILLGVTATLACSWLLSHTLLKGVPSAFTLELPPYRRPQIGRVIIRSIFDRTLFVLGRAAAVAAPAGALIWLLANIHLDGRSLLLSLTGTLDPLGRLMGLDGVILTAFLLGFPANEIVLPIILMTYLETGALVEMTGTAALFSLLTAHGWTAKTMLCMMIFCLFHWPCSTTCLTIRKETGSWRWTAAAMALPTLLGMVLCALTNLICTVLA